jgi:hypothetical protein
MQDHHFSTMEGVEKQPSENQHGTSDQNLKADGSIEPAIDPAKEKILLAKLDLFLTPVIMLVYLSCFLDRTNIV